MAIPRRGHLPLCQSGGCGKIVVPQSAAPHPVHIMRKAMRRSATLPPKLPRSCWRSMLACVPHVRQTAVALAFALSNSSIEFVSFRWFVTRFGKVKSQAELRDHGPLSNMPVHNLLIRAWYDPAVQR